MLSKKTNLCRSCPDFLTNENCLCLEKYSAMHKLHIVWQSIMLGKKTTQHGRWVEIKALITTTKSLEVISQTCNDISADSSAIK